MNANGTRCETHLELLNSPPGKQGKADSAYSASLPSVLHPFPSKSAFYFQAKLQKWEVVRSNSSAPLLLGLILFYFFYLFLSPELLAAQREQRHCQDFISSLLFKNQSKQLGLQSQKRQKGAAVVSCNIPPHNPLIPHQPLQTVFPRAI